MTQTPASSNGQDPNTGPSEMDTPETDETSVTKTSSRRLGLTVSIDQALHEVEELEAKLKAANKEAASHRIKAKELDALKTKLETDKLSETEKLQKELADLKAAREADVEDRIADKIRLAAAAMGFNQKILHRIPGMLDWANLDIDEKTGMPTNVDKLLKELKEEFQDVPGFFSGGRTTPTSGGATNPSRSAMGHVGEITRDNLVELMKPENFKALSESQKQQVYQLLIDRS